MRNNDGSHGSGEEASGTRIACPNCQLMAAAQQKLSNQVIQLRTKLDRILLCMTEVFEDGDGIDWRENKS